MSIARFIQGYYLGTPVFIILDLAFNAPVRVSFIDSLWLRGVYYLICVVCGLACYLRPAAAPWIGLGESSVNFFLVVLSVMLPVYSWYDTALEGVAIEVPITIPYMVNVALSGTVLLFIFYRSKAEILRGGGGRFFKGVG